MQADEIKTVAQLFITGFIIIIIMRNDITLQVAAS